MRASFAKIQPSLSFADPVSASTLQSFQRTMYALAYSAPHANLSIEDVAQHAALLPDSLKTLIMKQLKAASSVTAFVQELPCLRLEPRLGFEFSLAELTEGLKEMLSASTSTTPDQSPECKEAPSRMEQLRDAAEILVHRLGPETRSLVMDVWDELEEPFCLETFISALDRVHRPVPNHVCAPHLLIDALSSLVAAEMNFPFVPLSVTQQEVDGRMRAILIDWIVDVATRFAVQDETLHLTVNTLDRFLMTQSIVKKEFQLAGIGAFLLASKYEEVFPPELSALEYMSANAYTKEEILRMERNLFVALKFRVTVPSSLAIADCILADQDPRPSVMQQCLVSYILDASLMVFSYGQHRPSLLASAAIYLSRVWCEVPTPTPAEQVLSICSPLLKCLADFRKSDCRFRAIANKFMQSKYQRVHALPLPTLD